MTATSRAKPGRPRAVKAATPASRGRSRSRKGVVRGAGARLRAELEQDGDSYSVTVLINQAARVADRLEVLDALLSGDVETWLSLDGPRIVETGPKVVEVRVDVRVDNAVLEERQQATVFRHLLAQIHKQRAGLPGVNDDEDDVMDGL